MVAAEGLTRSFSHRPALHGLGLSAAPGERLAIRGSNGSGKTTLLRCILGTLTPTSGTVTVGGHRAGSQEARRLVGASLTQERSFYLRLTGLQNLLFFARLRGLGRHAAERAVDDLIHELELEQIAAQRADRCSTGQLQQLALARALVGEPPVLLLDEPTRSLDPEARARLWAALDRRPEATVLFATHLDEDLEHATSVHELPASK